MILICLVKSFQPTRTGICGELCPQYENEGSVCSVLARAECSNNVFPLKWVVSCELDKMSADLWVCSLYETPAGDKYDNYRLLNIEQSIVT